MTIDREASALLVFATNPDARYTLEAQFKERDAGRVYVALVERLVHPGEQTRSEPPPALRAER